MFGSLSSVWKALLLIPRANRLLSYVGQADHREDLAGLRVHRDDDAALQADRLHRPLERLLGVLLRLRVDRQRQRVAGLGLRDRSARTCVFWPAGVALDALGAVDAAQLGLVRRLDAGLADQVVGQVAAFLEVARAAPPRPGPCSRGSATSAGRRCTGGGPRRRPRRPGAASTTPEIRRAVSGSTSSAIRTRSKRDPGLLSIAVLMSAGSISSMAASRCDDLGPELDRQVGGPDLDGERRDVRDERAGRSGRRSGRAATGSPRAPSGCLVASAEYWLAVDDLQVEEPGGQRARPR